MVRMQLIAQMLMLFQQMQQTAVAVRHCADESAHLLNVVNTSNSYPTGLLLLLACEIKGQMLILLFGSRCRRAAAAVAKIFRNAAVGPQAQLKASRK